MQIEFRILGPVEVAVGGETVALAGGKQRALLALLLLHANEVVATERLVEELWHGRPSATAVKSVQLYVSQLRKVLGEQVLVTQPAGYLLAVDEGQIDARRAERRLAEARRALADGDPSTASRLLAEALALWRGRPLADFAYEDFAQAEIGRLDELRLALLEERVEADLALGRHADLVVELEALVAEHPLRERLRGQLMLALYRCGRQADALGLYREARRMFMEELGLEPGTALQRLQQQMLSQDVSLEAPERVEPDRREGRVAAAVPWSLRRRGPLFLLVGAALVGAGVAAAAFELAQPAAIHPPASRNLVAVIDPSRDRIVARVAVGNTPTSVAVGNGSVWALNADDATVSRIDPVTDAVVKTFATGGTPTDIAAGGGALWVGNASAAAGSQLAGSVFMSSVSRLDPGAGLVTHRVELPRQPEGDCCAPRIPGASQLTVGDGSVWAVDPDLRLARIDLASGRRVATVGGLSAVAVAVGREGVWVDDGTRTVARVDPRSNSISARIHLAASALSGIAVGAGAVWVTDSIDGTLWRIDPGPPAVTRTIPVGVGATGVSFGAGAVWVVNWLHGDVLRVNPRSNTVTASIDVAGTPQSVAVGEGRVWVSVDGGFGTHSNASSSPLTSGIKALPSSFCGPITYRGSSRLQYLIASDLPLQGPTRASTLPMTEAIQLVLQQHHFRAGRYTIGYQSCDDSTAQAGFSDQPKCRANVQAYAGSGRLLGLIGPYASKCASVEIPLAAEADLAMISAQNTYPGLTHGGPGTRPGEPGIYYPTGRRNYVRIEPPDDAQGAANALLARTLRLRSVYLLTVGDDYGRAVVAGFRRAAPAAHVKVAGLGQWDPTRNNYVGLVERIARSHAEGVLLGGYAYANTGKLVEQLRTRLGPTVRILATDGFLPIPALRQLAGRAAQGLYVSYPGRPDESLSPAGQRFVGTFAATQPGGVVRSYGAIYAAEATEVLLAAIAHSDGTRASVTQQLLRIRIEHGLLGSFHFNANGDIAPAPITIFHVTAAKRRSSTLIEDFDGATVARIIDVPANLLAAPRHAG
jgi:DNA-binding SARP family transcriptional activator/ABC-type branched-subunit amino acid transport system substrate-binding protein